MPADETSRHRYSGFLGYAKEVKKSGNNYLRIPITLYGLEGAGKSSVLGTWESAARDSPHGFMDDSWEVYSNRVTKPGIRGTEQATTIPDVHIDTRERFDKEGHVLQDPLPADWLSTFDVAELIFRDTAPAVSMHKDVKDDDLPFGLLVLVVSARRVESEMRKGAAATNPWGSLVSADGAYPPTACIIAGTNNVEHKTTTPDELCKWFVDSVGVKKVVAMPTFPIPSEVERDNYMRADVVSEHRREFNREWKQTMKMSLSALNELLWAIQDHESTGIRRSLKSEAEQTQADRDKWVRAVSRYGPVVAVAAAAAGLAYLQTIDEER